MSTSHKFRLRALLFFAGETWNLEPMAPHIGAVKTFETARDARRWAKRNNILAIRAQNLDA